MRRLGEDDAVKAVSSLFRLVAPASRYAKHDFVGDKGISLTEIVAPVRQIKAQPRAGGGSPYVPQFTVTFAGRRLLDAHSSRLSLYISPAPFGGL